MKRIAMAAATGAMTLTGSMALATPAQAAPLFTGGLVNVNVSDVIDGGVINSPLVEDVNVIVAAKIAAAVCGVNVGGILGQLRNTGEATCAVTNGAGDTLTITQ